MTKLLQSSIKTIQLTLLSGALMTTPLLQAQHAHSHADTAAVSGTLLQDVRQGTKQFVNVNNATAAGYGPFLGCVTGTDHGAMGIHYVNGTVLSTNALNPAMPTALIYEPQANGALRLVGVEFIVDATTWLAANNNTPPVLEGQVFNYVGAPNRFNINSFFELHVWAWRDNPQGSYVDWNNNVSCLAQQNPS
jgi:hypothetical protein